MLGCDVALTTGTDDLALVTAEGSGDSASRTGCFFFFFPGGVDGAQRGGVKGISCRAGELAEPVDRSRGQAAGTFKARRRWRWSVSSRSP